MLTSSLLNLVEVIKCFFMVPDLMWTVGTQRLSLEPKF